MNTDDSENKSRKDPSLPEGTFTYRSGISTFKYIGQFKSKDYIGDPIKHGEGKLYDPSGEVVYDGEFKDDLEHGWGEEVYTDGIYFGQFQKGQRHGHGQYNFNNGDKYKGGWEEGNFSGKGEYIFLSGNVCKGTWFNHEKHGRFVETFNEEPFVSNAGKLVRLECNYEYGTRTGRGSGVTKRGRRIEVNFDEFGDPRNNLGSWFVEYIVPHLPVIIIIIIILYFIF